MTTLPGISALDERRKKPVVTYGKPTRNPTFSAPSTRAFFDPSKTSASPSKLKRPTAAAAKTQKQPSDEFDIPSSEDDSPPPPPKSTKLPKKPTNTQLTATPDGDSEDSSSPRKRKRTRSQALQPPVARPPAAKRRTQDNKPSTVGHGDETTEPRRSKRHAPVRASVKASPTRQSPRNLMHTPKKRPATLAKIVSCPASPSVPSPGSPGDSASSISTTPKQAKLWHELLVSDPPDAHFQTSALSPVHASPTRAPARPSIQRSSSDMAPVGAVRKARLVDRLKTDAVVVQNTDESSENDTNEDEADTKIQPAEVVTIAQTSISQPAAQYSQSQSQIQASHTSTSQGALGKKVTYARSRTYLEDTLEDLLGDLSVPIIRERPSAPMRRTGAPSATTKRSKPDPGDDSDEDPSQGIRSIHELRAAGHKKRFLDDISRLIDDIKSPKPSSKSQRRSALMELAEKVVDKTVASRFFEYGFDRDLAAQFQFVDVDPIANILLCVILARLLQAEIADHCTVSLIDAGALKLLASCLEDTKNLALFARDRRNNMSKVAQSDFVDFIESIRTSDMWAETLPEHLSPRLVALRSVDSLIYAHRRNGNRGAVLPPSLAKTLVDLASNATTGTENVTQVTIDLSLSVLEAASTLDALDVTSNVWSPDLLGQIASALPRMLTMPKPTQALALRLSTNVVNNHVENCNTFSGGDTTQSIIRRIIEGFSHLRQAGENSDSILDLDLLLLALGLMINLTEFSDSARESASRTEDNGLVVLVDIFVRGREKASEAETEEEVQGNVAYGYLAYLLANLCENDKVMEQVCTRLPGSSASLLVEAMEEFRDFHRQVDSQTMDSDEGREIWARFTERLSAVVGRLQGRE